ncbi:hypothetical protein KI387_001136 [Taxus chinensis]|uniref:UspA domain-containing protein n=1 Tax=Taxus chinensis TaxID=29808 RepID=A0AA38LLA2_TAXCH|nr:hypothetical protein KI387_001136 [Taxus chinensis]
MGETQKPIVVGIDDSEQSSYALQWTLDHLLHPFIHADHPPFKLVLLHARPPATSVLRMAGPGNFIPLKKKSTFNPGIRPHDVVAAIAGAAEVLPMVETDLKKIGTRALDQGKNLCLSRSVQDIEVEMVEGDARNVLCHAVERHGAEMLVVGSHGYGAIKRAVLGSVSDYCAHHAKCTVMIVKKPKQ